MRFVSLTRFFFDLLDISSVTLGLETRHLDRCPLTLMVLESSNPCFTVSMCPTLPMPIPDFRRSIKTPEVTETSETKNMSVLELCRQTGGQRKKVPKSLGRKKSSHDRNSSRLSSGTPRQTCATDTHRPADKFVLC